MESESEWAQNKSVINLRDKSLRKTVKFNLFVLISCFFLITMKFFNIDSKSYAFLRGKLWLQ